MLAPLAAAEKRKRWALVYPNYEYAQSAASWFKTLLRKHQPNAEFVGEYAPPLGRIEAGATVHALA
jgi:branched-chain amino acid transport system substrate-binding protein